MRLFSKRQTSFTGADWRGFQTGLHQHRTVRPRRSRIGRRLCALALLVAAVAYVPRIFAPEAKQTTRTAATQPSRPAPSLTVANKAQLRAILDGKAPDNLTEKTIALPLAQQTLQVETSLDADLQNYLLSKLDRKHARDIGIVVMEADTGRVLAMAGFDKAGSTGNPCLRSDFPAASIFKIVTAASAVEHCNLTADSTLHFNGYKHTLYKRQLTQKINKYTNSVSFAEAFAQSINPVFGKIGEHRLGRPLLEKYAATFRFNQPLNFDLPLSPSRFRIDDDPYGWAEIASGFNRDTTLSPLHGALLASTVLNRGRMPTPSLVDRIRDPQGDTLYQGQPPREQQAMTAKASAVLSRLMQTTIRSGTARKYFRDYRRDRILSQLQIGGKTGSMGNRTHDLRFDWFVGFASERHGTGKIALAVMVAHEKYLGTRASQYARMAIRHYFGKRGQTSKRTVATDAGRG